MWFVNHPFMNHRCAWWMTDWIELVQLNDEQSLLSNMMNKTEMTEWKQQHFCFTTRHKRNNGNTCSPSNKCSRWITTETKQHAHPLSQSHQSTPFPPISLFLTLYNLLFVSIGCLFCVIFVRRQQWKVVCEREWKAHKWQTTKQNEVFVLFIQLEQSRSN